MTNFSKLTVVSCEYYGVLAFASVAKGFLKALPTVDIPAASP